MHAPCTTGSAAVMHGAPFASAWAAASATRGSRPGAIYRSGLSRAPPRRRAAPTAGGERFASMAQARRHVRRESLPRARHRPPVRQRTNGLTAARGAALARRRPMRATGHFGFRPSPKFGASPYSSLPASTCGHSLPPAPTDCAANVPSQRTGGIRRRRGSAPESIDRSAKAAIDRGARWVDGARSRR